MQPPGEHPPPVRDELWACSLRFQTRAPLYPVGRAFSPAYRIYFLERLQEFDQCAFIGVGESRLAFAGGEKVGSEIVALVDDEVAALADFQELRHQRTEGVARLLVGGVVGQPVERFLDVPEEADHLSLL